MPRDWSTAYLIGLLLILCSKIFLAVAPIGRQLDHRWIQPIANTCFEWLEVHLQALNRSFKDIIDATQNSSSLKARHCSPQLILFPKIRYLSEYERPTATQRVHFLSLPLEIRLRVYGLFFATEVYKPFELGNGIHSVHRATTSIPRSCPVLTSRTSYWPIVKIQYSEEATASSKLPLLLTNKKINTEARPLFYRHHTFKFECGKCESVLPDFHRPGRAHGPFDWMTKIELTNSRHHFPLVPRANSLHRQLCMLAKFCSRLRSLKVDYHMSQRAKPLPRIPDLWARLVHIEMRITSYDRMSDDIMVRLLEAITSAKNWNKVGFNEVDGYFRFRSNGVKQRILGVPQHIFRLDRVGSEDPSSRNSS